MSFHTISAHLQPRSMQWLTRFVLPFVIGAVVVTASGCSMVMGFFGPTEANVAGVPAEATRLLLPTPASRTAPVATIDPNRPTPTPFIMRPTAVADSLTDPTAAPAVARKPQVLITGDAVNIRNAPGLDSQVLLTAPRGATFDYVDQTPTGDWLQLCCVNNQLAWVYAELAQITTAAPVSAEPIATVASAVAVGDAAPASAAQRELFNLAESVSALSGFANAGDPTTFAAPEDGYAITLPASWLALAETNGVIEASIQALDQQQNPTLAAALEEQINLLGDIPLSLIAYDLAPEALQHGLATNLTIMTQPIPAGFPLDYVVQVSAAQLEPVLGLARAAQSTSVHLPAGEAIVLDYGLGAQTITRQYYLMNDERLYIVTFTAAAVAESTPQRFDEIMQSFRFQ